MIYSLRAIIMKRLMILILFIALIVPNVYAEAEPNPEDIFMNSSVVKFDTSRNSLSVKVYPEKQTVKISGGDIINHALSGESGDIQIAVYLTGEKYSGDTINGYKIVTQNYGQLSAGKHYKIGQLNQKYEQDLPTGSYYVTLVLLEYDHDDFYIVDSWGEDEKVIIPEKGPSDLDIALAILGGLAGQQPGNVGLNNQPVSNGGDDYGNSSDRQSLERALAHAESELAKDQGLLERQKERYYDQKRRGKDASAELRAVQATEKLIRSDEQLIASIKRRLSELN